MARIASQRTILLLLAGTTSAAILAGWLAHRVVESAQNPIPSAVTQTSAIVPLRPQDLEAGMQADSSKQRESADLRGARIPRLPENQDARKLRLQEKMLEYKSADGWEKTFSIMSPEDLLHEQDVVDTAIVEATQDEFDRRFRAGDYEIVSSDGTYTPKHFNPFDVYQIRSMPNGLIAKCTLPEAGFEDIYKLKAQSTWLYKQAHAKHLPIATK